MGIKTLPTITTVTGFHNISLRSYAKLFSLGKGKNIYPLNHLICHEGNLKIPSTTAIFNCSSATDCPSVKLGLCAAAKAGVKCYAKKSEYKYRPLVLPYRRKQREYWKKTSAQEFATQFLFINSLKKKPFTEIRLNESGDFYTQAELDKAELISKFLSYFNIKVYCYTSRKDLNFSKIKHLIVSGSGFRKSGITNEFRIIKNIKDKPKGYGLCCGNCRVCNRCKTRGKLTAVLAH